MRPHRLDQEKCDLCGLCQEICGRGIYSESDGKMQYDPEGRCIDCGHCMAVCPVEALVRRDGTVPASVNENFLPTPEALLHFLRSRRSSRRFREEAPPRDVLERLVEAARFAPTGTNKQDVKIVLVTDATLIDTMRQRIMALYGAYERHLASGVKRFFLKTFVDRRLGDPSIRAYLKQFMDSWRAGRDPLFHRAPVVALLHTGKVASTPRDDCCLALYHMVLMAERLGLGSCLLGTAEVAFAKERKLNDLVGVERGMPIRAAACFGYPRLRFERLADRRSAAVRWL